MSSYTSEASLFETLFRIVGPENVLIEDVDLLCYSRDRLPILASREYAVCRPNAVIKPQNTQQISEIVRYANAIKMPIIPRGAGTNFAGATVPVSGGIVVDMKSMSKILDIDEVGMTVRVQPGIVLETLEKELAKHGLTLGHDPGSFPTATIGGAISMDSTGWRAGRYGTLRDMVMGLEVVLPTGEILRTRAVPKSASGYSLKDLFISAEGTLGIITEASLKVRPLPEVRSFQAYFFENFETALNASIAILKAGVSPAAQTLMDEVRSIEYSEVAGETLKATLILCFEGFKEEAQAQEEKVRHICKRHEGKELQKKVAEVWWDSRHKSWTQAVKERNYDDVEISVPLSKVLTVRRRFIEILAKHGVANMGMGMFTSSPPTLSADIYFADKDSKDVNRYKRILDDLMRAALDLGGTMTHCIGVGIRSAHLMEYEHGIGLELMRRIKKTLDPNNKMNPRKMALQTEK